MYWSKCLKIALGVTAVAVSTQAAAIKYGELDGERHPHVGLMVAKDAGGAPMWRCSGTLVSERHFLTAGHCTSGATTVEIWFLDPRVQLLLQTPT